MTRGRGCTSGVRDARRSRAARARARRAACPARRAPCPRATSSPTGRMCRPGGRGLEEAHHLAVHLGVLDRHDRVGARRDRRAGRDPHGLAAADGRLGPVPDQRAAHDLQLDGPLRRRVGDVGGAHREPVHRRRRERGQDLASATTSSASTQPYASVSGSWSGASGWTCDEDPLARLLDRDAVPRRSRDRAPRGWSAMRAVYRRRVRGCAVATAASCAARSRRGTGGTPGRRRRVRSRAPPWPSGSRACCPTS